MCSERSFIQLKLINEQVLFCEDGKFVKSSRVEK